MRIALTVALTLSGLSPLAAQTASAPMQAEREASLTEKITREPSRWGLYKERADLRMALGRYQEAIDDYEAALALIRESSGKQPAPKSMALISGILTKQGNAFVKLEKIPEALTHYEAAAKIGSDKGLAYFNLCAIEYNLGQSEKSLAACEISLASEPNRADAWFIKGSILFGNSTVDKDGKMTPPPGALEALRKYLALAPKGGHASDCRQMLDAANAPVQTSYKAHKKH